VERLPHPGRVLPTVERLRKRAVELAFLADRLGDLYAEAYDAALSPSNGGDLPTLGRGFTESDPTGNTATNAQLRQLRWRAAKAARLIERGAASFDEAEDFLRSGFTLAFDEGEFARWLEKHVAAQA
jgi:hypothetical protein